jgi:Tfp pilus assembly protein PilF
MKNFFTLLVALLVLVNGSDAQSNEVRTWIDQGIQLHDDGKYAEAITIYLKILAQDSSQVEARYELSNSYLAKKEYAKALAEAHQVVNQKSKYRESAFLVKGQALDALGKKKEAIQVFTEAHTEFPYNSGLLFHLGFTKFKNKQTKEAEQDLEKLIRLKPNYANAYAILGFIYNEQKNRPKAVLCFLQYLQLDPKGTRAKACTKLLEAQFSQTDSVQVTLTDANFQPLQKIVQQLATTHQTEPMKSKPFIEGFQNDLKVFFSGLMENRKGKTDWWWTYHADYYIDLMHARHLEAYSYHVLQSKEGFVTAQQWIQANKEKSESYLRWHAEYDHSEVRQP